MTISPEYWGTGLWKTMYSIAFNYPEKNPSWSQKRSVVAFFDSLKILLPCDNCRTNYREHLLKSPLGERELLNRHNLTTWVNSIHNSTNKSIGKPLISLAKIASEIAPHQFEEKSPVPVLPSLPVKSTTTTQVVPRAIQPVQTRSVQKRGCGCGK